MGCSTCQDKARRLSTDKEVDFPGEEPGRDTLDQIPSFGTSTQPAPKFAHRSLIFFTCSGELPVYPLPFLSCLPYLQPSSRYRNEVTLAFSTSRSQVCYLNEAENRCVGHINAPQRPVTPITLDRAGDCASALFVWPHFGVEKARGSSAAAVKLVQHASCPPAAPEPIPHFLTIQRDGTAARDLVAERRQVR